MSDEDLRDSYRPKEVRLLLVGESPPEGWTFFYKADSNLYRKTAEAFKGVSLVTPGAVSFLEKFGAMGCFLDDLCHSPVNRASKAERRGARASAVDGLALRLGEMRPEVIVCVMKGIEREVRCAWEIAGICETPFFAVPFPSHGHQRQYVDQLSGILADLNLWPRGFLA